MSKFVIIALRKDGKGHGLTQEETMPDLSLKLQTSYA
jgi:hypothetical protein